MDQSAPEALTFGLATRALAELKGLDPALGSHLHLLLAGEEPCLAPEDPGERPYALLVVAERPGELPPQLIAAVREHLANGRYLVALSCGDSAAGGGGDAAGGDAAHSTAGEEEDGRCVITSADECAFRDFLERWRFERIFRVAPQLASHGCAKLELTIPSEEALIPGLSHTVGMLLREFGYVADDWMSTIPLVIDEVLTNAMRHGNQGCREKQVRVCVEIAVDAMRLTVTDEGKGFRREGVADPRQGDRVWRTGGRGIFLIEQLMDEVEYLDEGRTVVLVHRNRTPAPDASASEPSSTNGQEPAVPTRVG